MVHKNTHATIFGRPPPPLSLCYIPACLLCSLLFFTFEMHSSSALNSHTVFLVRVSTGLAVDFEELVDSNRPQSSRGNWVRCGVVAMLRG